MKPHGYALIVIFLGLSAALCAQPFQHNQTQTLLQRLYSTRTDTYDGNKFVPTDSAHYIYTGTRGGGGHPAEGETMPFDFAHYMIKGNVLWGDSLRTTKTYDANDNLLTFFIETFDGIQWNNSVKGEYHYNAQGILDVDSSYTWISGAWQGNSKDIYTFDSQGNETSWVYQYTTDANGNWINSYRQNMQYDANNREIEFDYGDWINGAWVNQERQVYTYDQFGNQNTIIFSNGKTGVWVSTGRSSYQYASKTKLLLFLVEGWDPYMCSFFNDHQTIYSYNANGQITRNDLQYWINSQWQDSIIGNYTYLQNNSGYIVSSFYVNAAQKTLDSNERFITLRDNAGNDILDSTDFYHGPGDWQHSSVHRWSFDANNNTTLDDYENWDANAGAWSGGSKYTASYNNFGQYITYEQYQWLTSGWAPSTLEYFWYEDYTGPASVRQFESAVIASQVYPSPFTKSFTIEFNTEKRGDATLLLYDMTGKLLTRTVTTVIPGDNKIIWDAGYALPSGCYTYELVIGNEISTGKILEK